MVCRWFSGNHCGLWVGAFGCSILAGGAIAPPATKESRPAGRQGSPTDGALQREGAEAVTTEQRLSAQRSERVIPEKMLLRIGGVSKVRRARSSYDFGKRLRR
jgi:hypothetical protein